MGLLEKSAHVIHKNHGWFTSEGFKDAEVASYGTMDGDVFERLGHLDSVNMGVPNAVLHSTTRTPRWFTDSGVTVGNWVVKGDVPGGLASLSVKLEFDSKYSIACFLGEHTEVRMENLDAVGDALVDLYRRPGKDWRLSRKWVYAALHVKTGFIVMSREKNTTVTLSGQGTINASGVPIRLSLDGFINSAKASLEVVGLDNITPFVSLCTIADPLFSKADWRQMG